MIKLPVSHTLAQHLFKGEQNIVVTDQEYNDEGNLITLVDQTNQQILGYATLDSCKCDIAKNIFNLLHFRIKNFTKEKFHEVTHHHKLVFVLKLSQIKPINT